MRCERCGRSADWGVACPYCGASLFVGEGVWADQSGVSSLKIEITEGATVKVKNHWGWAEKTEPFWQFCFGWSERTTDGR